MKSGVNGRCRKGDREILSNPFEEARLRSGRQRVIARGVRISERVFVFKVNHSRML